MTFARSPVMSTYLLAFVVGEFDYVEEKDSNGVLVRVYTPVGKKEQGKFALDVSVSVCIHERVHMNVHKDHIFITHTLSRCLLKLFHSTPTTSVWPTLFQKWISLPFLTLQLVPWRTGDWSHTGQCVCVCVQNDKFLCVVDFGMLSRVCFDAWMYVCAIMP